VWRQANVSDYKPELERLAKEREEKAEADKKSNLERAMRDMNVSGSKSKNPFGPHPRNDRQDRSVEMALAHFRHADF
jgi:hypothetical protein